MPEAKLRLPGDVSVQTRYVNVPRTVKWTFDLKSIRRWVEWHISGRVLNACAGKSYLRHDGEVVRNDIEPKIEADLHVDVGELSAHFPAKSFDSVVFDPPWNVYQANLRYSGHHVHKTADGREINIDLAALPIETPVDKEQLGHARLAKDGFDYLLKPGGTVIQLAYTGACMPARQNYERVERVMFDPIGEGKTVIGSVDRKTQTDLGRGWDD